MHQIAEDLFERFATQRKKDLQRIARHSGGEHQLADVVHEAWVMAWTLRASDGPPLNLANRSCQEKLLSHVYQHLVRYTEQNARRANHVASSVRFIKALEAKANPMMHPKSEAGFDDGFPV